MKYPMGTYEITMRNLKEDGYDKDGVSEAFDKQYEADHGFAPDYEFGCYDEALREVYG